ncbi:MAG: PAS domain S-box protein [Scytolyngbya sp. HA4215-MV1]|jgi:PAS domain S-box-containing protein|nr:PAS domain S-box protein [Scytolyngbya sp. HA4215-MV1]
MSVSPTVLLIDDSIEDREMYRRFLDSDTHYAYNIVETDSAIEALKWCEQAQPDVILLDYLMPDLNGLEVLTELMLRFGEQMAPVVMLTGQEDVSIAIQALKKGAKDYLIKGQLLPDQLCRTVRSVITQFRLQQRLAQQQQQQQVIAAITQQIRQSLNLQDILTTTVTAVQQLLNVDRVFMYQFGANMTGKIVAESVVAPWQCGLAEQPQDTCFYTQVTKDYTQGKTQAIDNIYEANLADRHIQLLEQFQVKAYLVVPVVIGNATTHLWGLLIAHQCAAPRAWQATETELLNQLTVPVAIAIQQSELYQQLEGLNTQLEAKVQARTAELERTNAALQQEILQHQATQKSLKESQSCLQLINAITVDRVTHLTVEQLMERIPNLIHQFIPDLRVRYCVIDRFDQLETRVSFQPISMSDCQGMQFDLRLVPNYLAMLRSGKVFVSPDITQVPELVPVANLLTQIEIRAMLAIPLTQSSEYMGLLSLTCDRPRSWSEQEIQMLVEIADFMAFSLQFAESQKQRQLAEQELAKSRDFYLTLFESFPALIWRSGVDAQCNYFNQSWLKFTGRTLEQERGEGWRAGVHPEDLDACLQTYHQAFAARQPFEMEYRLRHHSGEYRWLLDCGQAFYDLEGNFAGYLGYCLDITDRKQIEEALKRSELKYRRFYEGSQVAIFRTSISDGLFIDCNQRFAELVGGHSPEEFIGQKLSEGFHVNPGDRQWILQELRQHGRLTNYESQYRHLDGSIRWGLFSVWLNLEDQCLEVVASDITDRKQIEFALQSSEARLRAIFDHAAVGITQITAAGQFINVNRGYCNFVGYTEAELRNLTFQEITHPDDLTLDLTQTQRVLAGEISTFSMEKRFLCKNGEVRWGYLTVSLISDPTSDCQYLLGVLEDISDRKQTEKALDLAHRELTYLVENTPLATIRWNQEFRVQSWSKCAEEIFGWQAEEVLGKSMYEWKFLFEEDLDKINQTATKMLDGAVDSCICHNRNYRKDGSVVYCEWFNSVLLDEAGNITAMFSLVQDVSDRKQAEEKLRQSEERLLQAQRIAHIGSWEFDIATQKIIWSEELFRIYGLEPTGPTPTYLEWQRKNVSEDMAIHADVIQQAITQRTPYEIEHRIIRPDGSIRYLLSKGEPVLNAQGQVIQLVGTGLDITDRKQVEAELQVSEGRFRNIFEQAAVGLGYTNLSGQFLLVNQKYCDMLGYTLAEMTTIGVQEITHPEDYSQDSACFQAMLAGELPTFCIEKRFIRKDGSFFWGNLTVSLVYDAANQPQMTIGVVEEITDRKQTEFALKEAKEAAMREASRSAEANRAKSVFLANMSHELRTPLNAILGFSQLMVRDSSLSRDHQEHLGIINRSGEHLLNIINDILEMSKIEAGRITFNVSDFDLYQLLDTLEEMFQLRAENKGLRLFFDRAANLPQYIKTDENKLRQVLINLLGNAIKFTHKGHVTLRVKGSERCFSASVSASHFFHLCFEVKDTGPGIDAEEHKSLFEPFVQSKNNTIHPEGTGLGLPISQQFVHLMGGEITVESQLNQGATFKFEIPVELATSIVLPNHSPYRQAIALAPQQPSYRILLVEDNWANRQLLLSLLKPMGFMVKEATNGREAVSLWEVWQPHLIWMDIRMPEMDGYEAVRQIRAKEQVIAKKRAIAMAANTSRPPALPNSTKIIALTASAFEEERTKVLSCGCDDFVRKPFQESIILEKMAHYLGVEYLYQERSGLSTHANSISLVQSLPSSESCSILLPSVLQVMPIAWLTQLSHATMQLDPQQILALIQQIPEDHAELAQSLKEKVYNFDFEQILSVTQTAIESFPAHSID